MHDVQWGVQQNVLMCYRKITFPKPVLTEQAKPKLTAEAQTLKGYKKVPELTKLTANFL